MAFTPIVPPKMSFLIFVGKISEKINKGAIKIMKKNKRKLNPLIRLYILLIFLPLILFDISVTLASFIPVSISS